MVMIVGSSFIVFFALNFFFLFRFWINLARGGFNSLKAIYRLNK